MGVYVHCCACLYCKREKEWETSFPEAPTFEEEFEFILGCSAICLLNLNSHVEREEKFVSFKQTLTTKKKEVWIESVETTVILSKIITSC